MSYYGIDLGTTNCLAAELSEGIDDFELRCLPIGDGEKSMPSVVSFHDENTYVVGEKAKQRLLDAPDSTVELIKVRLGKTSSIPIRIQGNTIEKTPQELTALILRHINNSCGNVIEKPVLTVPAYFDQSQKDATMQSGRIAGMEPEQLIEEPTAAIIYQLYSEYQKQGTKYLEKNHNKNYLVFDFGGGTLDLSLINIRYIQDAVKADVLAISGDNNLGGNIIDFLFAKLILKLLCLQYRDDSFLYDAKETFDQYLEAYLQAGILLFPSGTSQDIRNFINIIKREAERVKKELSFSESSKIVLTRGYKSIPITRKQFNQLVLESDELNIRVRVENAIKRIAASHMSIDNVLLVGGSAKIPHVQEILTTALSDFGFPESAITTSSDSMNAVALGSAIQAALRLGVYVPPFKTNKLTSVVPRDLFIRTGKNKELFVKQGSKYPFTTPCKKITHIPHALSPEVPIILSECISSEENSNLEKEICSFSLYLPLFYTGDPLSVSLEIDEAGLYKITVNHIPTSEEVEFEADKKYALAENDVARLKQNINNMREIKPAGK